MWDPGVRLKKNEKNAAALRGGTGIRTRDVCVHSARVGAASQLEWLVLVTYNGSWYFCTKQGHWISPEMVSAAELTPVEDGSGVRWLVRSGEG